MVLAESANASRCQDMLNSRVISDFDSVLEFFNTLLGVLPEAAGIQRRPRGR